MTFLGSHIGTEVSGFFLMFANENVAPSFTLYDIAKSLTRPGWVVIGTLLLMSIYMIAVGIERYLTYSKAKQQSRQYAPKVAQALKNSNIDEAINISDKHKDSHLAMIVSSGLKEFAAHQGNTDISGDEMEASKRALQRAIAVKTAELKRGLAGLATVGSTAPFVGLFGTVWGIMRSFSAIAVSKNTNLSVVAPGIAEALFATAMGLVAAIPAVLAYNKISTDLARLAARLEGFGTEFGAILSRQSEERA